MAAAGLGVVVVCGVLVANRTLVGTDAAVFRRINHWPGWLYPLMWTVQLSGVIGALPLVAAAAALFRRLRLAVALAAATLLKVSLETVTQKFVQRDRPAETLPDVILRGQSAAHGLSFPSGHAMVIFTIAALVAPISRAGGRSCPGRWAPRCACRACISVRTSPWMSSRGRGWACSSGACSTSYSACPAPVPAPPAPTGNGEAVGAQLRRRHRLR
jgi:membrane-associated phospholipid phosphatase